MSQHSATSATTTTTTSATTTTTTSTTEVTITESSAKSSSSTGSLKKQKNKDAQEPLTDDFVLMSTPDKFKDKNINETNVVKRHHCDSSQNEIIQLDCLLLSDTSLHCVPLHVERLLQHFDGCQLNQAEILFLLVYVVALESGFVGQSDFEQAKGHLDQVPAMSSFHSKNVLHLSHLKPVFNTTEDKTRFAIKLRTLIGVDNASSDHLYGLLIGFVTGDCLIVTLSPANSTGAKGFSTALSIGRYVLSMQAKNKPRYQRFRKLDELSNVLRDQLFMPMRCQHLCWLECYIYPSLDGMPAELYDNILQYLSKNQLKILANVNKSLYNLTQSSKYMQRMDR